MNPADAFRMAWEECFHRDIEVLFFSAMAGGSINQVFKMETSEGCFVVKMNSLSRYPQMFSTEAMGLQLIAETGTIQVPAIVAVCSLKQHQLLLLEYVEAAERVKDYFVDFAAQLAAMHRNTSDKYGLHFNNRIGSLPQDNTAGESLTEFMIRRRLAPQLRLALRSGRLEEADDKKFQGLFGKLNELIPVEKPALVHGDLWSGNVITGSDGRAWLIDPAVAFYHREADIAMSRLFAGFDEDFYTAYNQVFPLMKGWEERIDLWNLYPLLVHVNLFGGGYVKNVRAILKRFM